ncbi:MAG: Ig-like domain-containing protein [Ignavibacterium sp.]|jgi:hypothetical protein|nr:Ig-like domain-containing protein [Ignavibacterium sp.]
MLKTLLLIIIIFATGFFCEVYPQSVADTSKVLLRFSEPMSRDGIFDISNYTIFRDDNTPVRIFKIGVVPGDSAVVLFTEKHIPNCKYKVIISNLRDKSGNLISEDHNIASY